jgi:hypothetical protein
MIEQRNDELKGKGAALRTETRMIPTARSRTFDAMSNVDAYTAAAIMAARANAQIAPFVADAQARGVAVDPDLLAAYIEFAEHGLELVAGKVEDAMRPCRDYAALLTRLVSDFKEQA